MELKRIENFKFEKLRNRKMEERRNAQFLAYRELCISVNNWNLSNIEIEICKNKKGEEISVQQLKYVLKVAEVGSITEAAKLLFISQPSLSNSIKETEKETGITIFLRSRTGITLTKDGAEQFFDLLHYKCLYAWTGKYSGIKYRNKLWI